MRVVEAMDFESNTLNWLYPFDKMSKKYGREFIEMLKAMWQANGEGQTEDEFVIMNGIPKSFFEKVIKK
ncbi:MAG: hypothetical protein HC836_36060 [Richelia sp. RM2_1_2]|nr:hypothetical protein [Richelia sp. RM2_1_2]